ncbi:hypothetical protein GH714_029921 [Hevea brasiliensis]|uniref:Uncharacterized protein n=1 Tax=Hevea brasiliensis TaxID=3981 RepID=A0A6A6N3H1_HEVBR|nr:hypothetical protein GH714_029921 [Hevea brasiliensis]
MAGQIPFSILEQVLTKLGSLAFQEIGLVCCARDDLKKLGNSLSTVKAVLVDAEEKQEQSHAVQIWIRRLQDIVYEAEELVDEMATHDLRGMVQGQRKVATQVLDFFSSSNQIWFRLKVGHRIKDIREKLKEVENEISSLNLEKKIIIDVRDKSSGRETSSVLKPDIIGREKDKEKMTLSLLNPTSSQGSVSVNAIVGIGGLGKTALAQLVYMMKSKDDDLEDIGDQYFNELSSRSFFHQSERMNGYKMHDLIHDLAQSMAKDRVEYKGIPNSIARLKYLRYLDISRCKMETLPKSINNLQNLQTLILSYCRRLRELPRDIEKLISLRCLMINGCESLRCMPIGLGKLTCLRQLSDFVVAWDEGSKGAMLNELNNLNQLKGRIVLHDLINVENVEIESNQVNLREKKHLQYLVLRWSYSFLYEETGVENNELFLEKLEPHPNLQSLVVESFMGKQLPPLHQLPSLKTLCLEELVSLEYVSDEEPSFLASPSITLFPSLQEIELNDCYNLRGWWRKKRSGVELAQFPCLSKMQIRDCRKLIVDDGEVIEWGSFRSLQSLSIRFLSELKSLPKGLQFVTNLQELIIYGCYSLMALRDWISKFTSLQRLEISYCPNLRSLPEGMHLLTSLQKLKIEGCGKLSARCTKEKGVDWPKIAHIPNLEIEPPGF